MLKVLFALVVLAALALAFAFAPVHGRTMLDRWAAADGVGQFVERGWAELTSSVASARQKPQAAHAPAHATQPARRQARPAPAEHYTAQDHAALDRIVAEHAGR